MPNDVRGFNIQEWAEENRMLAEKSFESFKQDYKADLRARLEGK
jgi:hypothetical protein